MWWSVPEGLTEGFEGASWGLFTFRILRPVLGTRKSGIGEKLTDEKSQSFWDWTSLSMGSWSFATRKRWEMDWRRGASVC